MSSVDERIVSMKFDNAQFEKGVKQTTDSLDGLKQSLSMDEMGGSLKNISSKLSVFGAVAFTAIQGLTNSAIGFGKKIAGAVLDPLVEGGKKRALNIEQAKFQFQGLGMSVEKSMADALYAVKNTAFGLDEAAVAAAQFGASGVKNGKDMQNALRGISGVAAMTGSSYTDIASVFTKVAGQGRLMGDDLNRLGARGVNAAATLGKAMGKSETDIRDMVSHGKISFNDFSKAMNDAFGAHATEANKTYTGSLANLRAALARIGATTFTAFFERQRDLFNSLTPKVDDLAEAFKPLQLAWANIQKEGNDSLIKFINGLDFSKLKEATPVFASILQLGSRLVTLVLEPIDKAFKQIFPPIQSTSNGLKDFATNVQSFIIAIMPTAKTMDLIQRSFAGFFAVLDIGWTVLKAVIGLFGDLFSAIFSGADKGSFSILEFTANLGDFLVRVRDAIKNGTALGKVFKVLSAILTAPIRLFKALITALSGTDGHFEWADFWNGIANALKAVWKFLKPVADWFVAAFKQIKEAVKSTLATMNFNSFVGIIGVGAIGGLMAMVYNFIHLIKTGLPVAIGKSILGPVRTAFSNLFITLQGMQVKLKAETLLKIAFAIGVMAASIFLLSLIPADRLGTAVTAIALLMGGMIKFMQSLDLIFKSTTLKDTAKMTLMIISLSALGTAMLLLAGAVAIFAALSWEGIAKGVSAIVLLLAAIAGFSWIIGNNAKLIAVSVTLGLLGVGISILAGAVAILAALSWEGLAKGVGTIVVLLAAIAGFSNILGKSPGKLIAASVSLLLIGTAMLALAKSVGLFAKMSLEDIAKGLIAMGGALAIIAIAMAALPASVIVSAAAIMIVATSLSMLNGVMKQMAKMSWEEIGKSMVVMGGALAILAGAMALMGIPIVLLGAVGILAASVAMLALAPALVLLGSMSWDAIGRGLAMLASALGILALGGVLLIPAIPAFLALGLAALMIGEGALLASVGIAAMAVGIIALAAAATVGIAAIKMVVLGLLDLIPAIAKAVADGLTSFITELAANGQQVEDAFFDLLTHLITAIIKITPKIGLLIQALVDLLIQILTKNIPQLADAGLQMLLGLLKAIEKNLPLIIPVAGNIIVEFIKGLGQQALKIAKAAGDTVLSFINGITDYVKNNSQKFTTAGSRLFRAVIDGISNAITQGGSDLAYAGQRIGDALWQGAKNALGINSPSKKFQNELMPSVFEGIERGNDDNINRAEDAGTNIGNAIVDSTRKALSDAKNAVAMDPNMSPTITPVLDLSAVKKDAAGIGGILTPKSLVLDGTIAQATYTASAVSATQTPVNPDDGDNNIGNGASDTYNFYQYNNSPKSLSEAEIYRQTNNQISTAKAKITTKGAPKS